MSSADFITAVGSIVGSLSGVLLAFVGLSVATRITGWVIAQFKGVGHD